MLFLLLSRSILRPSLRSCGERVGQAVYDDNTSMLFLKIIHVEHFIFPIVPTDTASILAPFRQQLG